MSRFVTFGNSKHAVNLDHVRSITSCAEGGVTVTFANGDTQSFDGKLPDSMLELLTAPVVAAAPGYTLLAIRFSSDETIEEMLSLDRRPVLAWRVMLVAGLMDRVEPVALEGWKPPQGRGGVLCPDGVVVDLTAGGRFESLDAWVKDVRKAREKWCAEHYGEAFNEAISERGERLQ